VRLGRPGPGRAGRSARPTAAVLARCLWSGRAGPPRRCGAAALRRGGAVRSGAALGRAGTGTHSVQTLAVWWMSTSHRRIRPVPSRKVPVVAARRAIGIASAKVQWQPCESARGIYTCWFDTFACRA